VTTCSKVMLFARHTVHLGMDVISYSVTNRLWWMVPLMAALALVAVVLAASHAAVPYTIYTLF
jgi:hypothetical protein